MMSLKHVSRLTLASTFITLNVSAGELTIPNQFSAGNTAVASEVNDNFTAVKTEVDDNNSNIIDMQNTITALEQENTALNQQVVNLEAQINALAGSLSSAVAIPIFPRKIQGNTADRSFDAGRLVATVQFNLAMDTSSFNKDNIRISGSGIVVETVSLVWSDGNSTLTFTSDSTSAFSTFAGCGSLTLLIEGDGANPVKDLQGKPLDGDRDGVPGGNFQVIYFPTSCI